MGLSGGQKEIVAVLENGDSIRLESQRTERKTEEKQAGVENNTGSQSNSTVWVNDALDEFATQKIQITHIAFGKQHYLSLDANGNVYTFGDNSEGQLGLSHVRSENEPKLISKLAGRQVVSIACGDYHSAAVTASGDVYCWGRGAEGQLGTDNLVSTAPTYVAKLSGARAAKVSCGATYTAVLTDCGTIYYWGSGLCHKKASAPTKLTIMKGDAHANVASIATGSNHLIAADDEGRVYGIGLNTFSQLGLNTGNHINDMTEIPLPEGCDAESVYAGPHYSCAVCFDGSVLAWGSAKQGQLGFAPDDEQALIQTVPRRIDALKGVCVETMSCADDRMLCFVETSINTVEPKAVAIDGGSDIKIIGEGIYNTEETFVVVFETSESKVAVEGSFHADDNSIRVTVPDLQGHFASLGEIPYGHTLEVGVSVSLNGEHFSNTYSISAFRPPRVDQVSCSPQFGPVQGGSSLVIEMPLDSVSTYSNVQLRFVAEDFVSAPIPATVESCGSEKSIVRATSPILPVDVFSKDKTEVNVEICLDETQWLNLGGVFVVYNLSTPSLSPSSGVCIEPDHVNLEVQCSGMKFSSTINVEFSRVGTSFCQRVPAQFISSFKQLQIEREQRIANRIRLKAEKEAQKKAEAEERERVKKEEEERRIAEEEAAAQAAAKKGKGKKAAPAKAAKETPAATAAAADKVEEKQDELQQAQEEEQGEEEEIVVDEPEVVSTRELCSTGRIVCRIPSFASVGPGVVDIKIALNNVDYVNSGCTLTVLPVEPTLCVPSCGPVSGGTVVKVYGGGIFSTKSVSVRTTKDNTIPPAPEPSTDDIEEQTKDEKSGGKKGKEVPAPSVNADNKDEDVGEETAAQPEAEPIQSLCTDGSTQVVSSKEAQEVASREVVDPYTTPSKPVATENNGSEDDGKGESNESTDQRSPDVAVEEKQVQSVPVSSVCVVFETEDVSSITNDGVAPHGSVSLSACVGTFSDEYIGDIAFHYYTDPVVTGVSPSSVLAVESKEITVEGTGFIVSPDTTVKLVYTVKTEEGEEVERSIVVPATFVPKPADDSAAAGKASKKPAKKPAKGKKGAVEEVEEAPKLHGPSLVPGTLVFSSPTLPEDAPLPIEASVWVALNGQQYVGGEQKLKLEADKKKKGKK